MTTKEIPSLTTARLILRACTMADAADMQRLAGDRDIAATTLRIPHPYEDGMAEQFMSTHQDDFDQGLGVSLAIALRSDGSSDGTYMGGIGLTIEQSHDKAEMGYWIGKPYCNQGYVTEAASAVVGYAFETLGLNRVYASHFKHNPASGRIMQKIGMTHEGSLRQHLKKWGQYVDSEYYGILRSEFQGQ